MNTPTKGEPEAGLLEGRTGITVTFRPFDAGVQVPAGTSLLDAIRAAQLPVKASCGGKGTCGGCLVRIIKGDHRKSPSAALPNRLAAEGYALACRVEITGNLTVELPEFQELVVRDMPDSRFVEAHKDQISGSDEFDPPLKAVDLHLPPATVEHNYGDLTTVVRELRKKAHIRNADCDFAVLKKLARTVREDEGRVSLAVLDIGRTSRLIDIWPARDKRCVCGVACDLGTSTVVLHLVDMATGRVLATASGYNQQIKRGEDVISRLDYARKPDRLKELQDLAVLTVNHLIQKTAHESRVPVSDIAFGVFAGNTAMIHLLLGLEPRFMREEPYVPTFNEIPVVPAHELGLKMGREARIYCAPVVGSYVGGDITAGLLASPLLRETDKVSMLIDVGTNGELVVGNGEWLITCACSAGPAFEGGGIKCGMPASEGAVSKVRMTDDGGLDTVIIGGGKPKGLCGSGLVDLLGELFIRGMIDRGGKFRPGAAAGRLVETETGPGFLVESGDRSFWGHDLVLTERDITALIRTKGAVFSACSLLLKNVGLATGDVHAFYISGGFGQSLDIENAVRIGLLPDLPRERFHYLGNSSLLGAYLILRSKKNAEMVGSVADKMTYVELNTEPGYMNEYTGSLFLPHTDMSLFPSVKRRLAGKI
jgi:uncharacterized 2Fe-2S/4Fe-4S cluster protein (DUF4445 family)